MAVEWSKELNCTRGSEYNFYPEQIVVKPELNGRHEAPDIQWLIDSILADGQLQPVIVRKVGEVPYLVAGYSRWRAVAEINKQKLAPVKLKLACTSFRGNEQEAFLVNIAENKARNQTTPLDDAHNIRKLEQWHMSVDDIAKVYHEKPQWVKDRLALISLEPEAREALKNGTMKVSAAKVIAKMSAEQQREAIKTGKLKTADVKPSKHWTFGQVKETLTFVVREGKAPDGFTCTRAELQVIDTFCSWLLEKTTGREA